MSKFKADSFKNMKSQEIPITMKVSQNKLRKLNKNNNKNEKVDIGITDEDFEKMMEENEQSCIKQIDKYPVPNKDNLSESVKNILNINLLGEELVGFVQIETKFKNISGTEYLIGLLETIKDPEDLTWISLEKYGGLLKYLFESNINNQVICLLILQNYAEKFGFIKINYKGKQIYQIRLLFQLFFTNEIIDESACWEWQEYLESTNKFEENTKKLLVIQTTDFFQILKTVFEEEGEDEGEDEEENGDKQENKGKREEESDDSNDSDNSNNLDKKKFQIPDEQDYNMEENDFSLDDL